MADDFMAIGVLPFAGLFISSSLLKALALRGVTSFTIASGTTARDVSHADVITIRTISVKGQIAIDMGIGVKRTSEANSFGA